MEDNSWIREVPDDTIRSRRFGHRDFAADAIKISKCNGNTRSRHAETSECKQKQAGNQNEEKEQ